MYRKLKRYLTPDGEGINYNISLNREDNHLRKELRRIEKKWSKEP